MTIEELYGISGGDINEVMQRIPGKALLCKLVKMFADDPNKSLLDKSIEAGDVKEAFRAVHTLKGVTLSLGFSGLGTASSALTEKLRAGAFEEGWKESYAKLCAEYEKMIAAIAELES